MLPWILGAVAVTVAAEIFSDDEEERADQRRRERRREAREERAAFEKHKQMQQKATQLSQSKKIVNAFFKQHYKTVPQQLQSCQNLSSLQQSVNNELNSNTLPSKVSKATKKVQQETAVLQSIDALINELETLKKRA